MITYTVPYLVTILIVQVNCEKYTITKSHVRNSIRIMVLVFIINFIFLKKITLSGLFKEKPNIFSDFLHQFPQVELFIIIMEIWGRINWNITWIKLIKIQELWILLGCDVISDENSLVVKGLYPVLSLWIILLDLLPAIFRTIIFSIAYYNINKFPVSFSMRLLYHLV